MENRLSIESPTDGVSRKGIITSIGFLVIDREGLQDVASVKARKAHLTCSHCSHGVCFVNKEHVSYFVSIIFCAITFSIS